MKSASAAVESFAVTCPLDCPDACRLVLDTRTDENGRRVGVTIRGDASHPVTRGFACV
ncbi:MAG TPA: hypothetical protein VHN99_01210, partial [Deinococcales bacterium]|nr:hypothetical protein [Deinococcales bacterium]